jgi:hypothetical protein
MPSIEKKGYAVMAICISLVLFCVSAKKTAHAAVDAEPCPDNAYCSELVKKAEELKLWDERYWHVLMHYQKKRFGHVSVIDDPKFFLSPQGKKNPRAELVATIRSLFLSTEKEDEHTVCRFIARYAWLRKELNIDESKLPISVCEKYSRLLESIQPRSVNLIFPTSHINSPASMFGHTLLTIETANNNKLLSHAINYSAITDDTVGSIFTFKGVFGMYKGYFSILPYYMKIMEYGDFDYRDIWEYELDFTQEEVERLVMHLVELEDVYSHYFFFDENCSFNLLFLLEVARPSLRLTDDFNLWVVPVDTIRKVEAIGLVKKINYRPSETTRIKYMSSALDDKKQIEAKKLALGKLDSSAGVLEKYSREDRIRIIDLASEYIKFLFSRGKISQADYRKRFRAVLGLRSELSNETVEYNYPVPENPLRGHESTRASLWGGFYGSRKYMDLEFRPAYHEFLDSDRGYVESGQIVFGKVSCRYYPEENKFQFQRFDILDVVALAPMTRFFKSFSWKAQTGLVQKYFDDDEHLAYRLDLGAGGSVRPWPGSMIYLLGETSYNMSTHYRDFVDLGFGGTLGMYQKIVSFWKMHFYARDIYNLVEDFNNKLELGAAQQVHFTVNTAMEVTFAAYTHEFRNWEKELRVGLHIFF